MPVLGRRGAPYDAPAEVDDLTPSTAGCAPSPGRGRGRAAARRRPAPVPRSGRPASHARRRDRLRFLTAQAVLRRRGSSDQRAARTIRSGRTTTTAARLPSHRCSVPRGSSIATSVAVGPPHARTRRRPGELGAPGPEDVVEPAAPSVDERPPAAGTSVPGQPAARPGRADRPPDRRQRRRPAVGRQPGDRRDPADDGQHPPTQRRRRPGRPGSSAGRAAGRRRSAPGRAARARPGRCRAARSPASPARTAASFQASWCTSRSPRPSPCPTNGGLRWAASPARSTRPARQRSATSRAERVLDRPHDLDAAPGRPARAARPAGPARWRRRPSPPAPAGAPSGTGRR